jgi:hypothetical protein
MVMDIQVVVFKFKMEELHWVTTQKDLDFHYTSLTGNV